jgi:alcohol dehydrogenase YqhD (iron-dependent ADH family)
MFDFEFYNPVRVIFGIGKVDSAGDEAAKLGKKALLVSYAELGPLSDLLPKVKGLLSAAGVESVDFFAFQENPDIATVREGVALAKAESCNLVLAVGGGSVMDASKAIAAGVFYEGDLWNMVNSRHDGSSADIAAPEKALPLLTISTLPATGSEMNMCSVISNREIGEKSYIWAECLFPAVSILDPALTASLPAFQSACAAADTISHVLEIYINSREDTPLQHRFQEGVMVTTIDNITAVLDDPSDLEARGNLMWASTCAINGWSWPGDGWTPMHQVGHVITTRHGVNHGTSLSVIMPHWMRYNAPRRPNTYKMFATNVMGIDAADKSDEQVIGEGIDAFEAFLQRIGVATKLSDIDVSADDLPAILDVTVKVSFGDDGNLNCNPIMSKEDVLNVLTAAL